MKRLFFFAILLWVGQVACAGRSGSANSSSNKISFGLYDLSSSTSPSSTSGPASASEIKMPEPMASNTAANVAGIGRREHAGQVVKQNISLTQTTAAQVDTRPTDRKIIRNAELNLEAGVPEDAQREITAIAETKGGFVVESQQSASDVQSSVRDIVTMTVRVPSDKFGETLSEIRGTASRVVLESVKGQDVTEEFIDIEAQLRAKKALELQFMEIMKRANNVEDALSVQSQLADVRGEIERIEGRKRFLDNQSSLSTIKIRLQTAKVFAASSAGFSGRLAESFSSGADIALNFVLGLVTLIVAALPFAAFVGLPVFLVIRYVLKRQSRPKSVTEIAQEEIEST